MRIVDVTMTQLRATAPVGFQAATVRQPSTDIGEVFVLHLKTDAGVGGSTQWLEWVSN